MDPSKAFGTVEHAILLEINESYGVDNHELDRFSDYLFNRIYLVQLDNVLSIPIETRSAAGGVKKYWGLYCLLYILMTLDNAKLFLSKEVFVE